MNYKSIIALIKHKQLSYCFALLWIIGFHFTAHTQTVFAPVGATWEYDFESEAYTGTELIKVVDTLSFGNKTFKVLTSQIEYRSNFSNQVRTQLDTFFLEERNDSILFKYKYDVVAGGRELLYFTPNASDSIDVYQYSYYINRGPFNPILIEGIDQFIIQQINQCLINGTVSTNIWEGYSEIGQKGDIILEEQLPLRFSEKFGPINDFFLYYAIDQDQNKQASFQYPNVALVAYQDEEIGLVKFSSEECDSLSSTKALQQENILDFNCFWNNELKSIYVEMKRIEDTPVAVQLFDARGVVLLTQTVHSLQQEISIPSNLQNGIYFVKISNKKGRSNVKKISIINY